MNFLEKDLEDIIFNTDNEKLCSRGLFIGGKKIRQPRIGNYGIADIISYRKIYLPFARYSFLKIDVWELKKEEINTNTLLQAVRYCKGIKRYLEKYRDFQYFNLNINLIGKHINTNETFIYLTDLIGSDDELECSQNLNEISLYTYEYNFDGIFFKREHGYCLTNEGFGTWQTE